MKKIWEYGFIGIVLGLAVGYWLISDSKKMILRPADTKEVMKDADGIPKIEWKMLFEYDFEKKKGPKELTDLDGKMVRIPGFIVPLVDNISSLREFLLVPDPMSCIHVPPPPPNLIVTVKLRQKVDAREVSNPSWVYGILKIEPTSSQYGGSAYQLDAIKLEAYRDIQN